MAFLAGRYILDGPLVISEIMSWERRTGRDLFLFKTDFEKAYDNVNWEFLLSIMSQMSFPKRWCKWIYGVVSSARSSVLVNGSPTFEFDYSKVKIGAFDGVILPNGGPKLSHLLYADDAIILGE
ncbi:uncharacterized protein LOC110920386 [Helianthus annuus]|uniref:uncharacterized protein LOC110920386 n=1 Tax=Helianthus annuus TaxID=4232 RepID=UPI000B8F9ADB|nr:uncharacterized protein LOC110920386 [Helianthus annuus]